MLSASEVATVRSAVAEVIADIEVHRDRLYEVEQAYTDRPGEVVCHFLGGFRVHPVLRALIFHKEITMFSLANTVHLLFRLVLPREIIES